MNNCENDLKAGSGSELLNILLVCERKRRERKTHTEGEGEKVKAGESAQSLVCAKNYSFFFLAS